LPYSPGNLLAVATKSRRIEMRADEETDRRIALAAQMTHQSVSSFVLGAARVEADRLLAEQDTTMRPEQFDALIASLDDADPAPSLRRLGSQPAAFER
jgi:uncharacterized protein (DUF1778 family)